MTPFQSLRLWARRAPASTRASALVAVVLAVGLLAWAVQPVDDEAEQSVAFAPAAEAAAPAAAEASVPTTSPASGPGSQPLTRAAVPAAPGSGPTAGGGATSSAAAGGCSAPPGGDQGISAKEVAVAVVLISIAGPAGNATFGIPSEPEQRRAWELVIADLNGRGGVACRTLAPRYFSVNPADPGDQQSTCLGMIEAKVFAVIDSGGYSTPPAAKNCILQQGRLPFFTGVGTSDSEMRRFRPLLFSSNATAELLHRNTVRALAARGFFTTGKGFAKLGVLWRDCAPEVNRYLAQQLGEVGVKGGAVVTYSVGCPVGFASPADLQQAVLKFRQSGVTHVMTSNFTADFPNFTRIAQQQGFKPVYGMADEGQIASSSGLNAPNAENLDGAVAITTNSRGADPLQGPQAEPTKRCERIFTSKGLKPLTQQPVGFGGVVCNLTWMFEAAVGKAPALQRPALAQGLNAARSVPFSYPIGPNDFSTPGVTHGGQFWRPLQFSKRCACWTATDLRFSPSFT